MKDISELNLISLGIAEKEDISIKALEKSKKCEILYLENYTSVTPSKETLSKFIGNKNIVELSREDLEENSQKIIKEAKTKMIGILVGGDCLSATTHHSLILEAKKNRVKVNLIHGSSIFTAVAETGLFLYSFGRTASIPFNNKAVTTPIEILKLNQKANLHTLFLLDLNLKENKFLAPRQAIEYLVQNKISNKETVLVCARLGCKNFEIVSGTLEDLKNIDYGKPPYCLIIPGKKLHFIEEEMIKKWTPH